MPIKVKIDHDTRWVEAVAEGELSLEDIEVFLDAVIVGDALPYRKLFDAREAEPRLSDDDVMVLGARVSAYEVHDPRGPVAAVAMGKEASALLQRFMNLGGAPRPMRLFGTIEDARRWLGQEE